MCNWNYLCQQFILWQHKIIHENSTCVDKVVVVFNVDNAERICAAENG